VTGQIRNGGQRAAPDWRWGLGYVADVLGNTHGVHSRVTLGPHWPRHDTGQDDAQALYAPLAMDAPD
jgi:hypothetical protein